jgi:polyhydroxyalkanoate synthase
MSIGDVMADSLADAEELDIREQVAAHTLAANPLVGVRTEDIVASTRLLLGEILNNPAVAARQYVAFLVEFGRIATGGSALAPDPKDRRFADSAWKDNAAYRTLAQSYLAWGNALYRFLDEAEIDDRDAERARFLVSLIVDALSPTNWLAGNPAALRKLVETGGASLLHGFENFVRDVVRNGGLPAQVDTRTFAVGENLGTTPGSVVLRTDVMELIQYRPTTDEVHQRPLLIAPPQINKFYVFDLVPEKSIIRYCLEAGLQTFAISWKNPTAAERGFGLDTYVGALDQAVDAMRAITGSEDVNIWGSCSGGITTSAFLAHLAARRSKGSQRHHCGLPARHGGNAEHHGRTVRDTGIDHRGKAGLAAYRRRQGPRTRAHVRLDAAQRPDLELLGQQLSARQCAARFRRSVLE